MKREEYKLHSNNFTNTLLDTLKDVMPSSSDSSTTANSADQRKLNDVWALKLRSTRIVEASIFKHLHSELANLPFVSPITQLHSNKCKSFLTETQSSLTNETFYLGRLLEFRKLPLLKDLREASGKKSPTKTSTTSTTTSSSNDSMVKGEQQQDLFETLIQSFEAAELYSKQSRVMTNDQLEKQIRFFTSLISKFVKTLEEKDKLNNLIHSPINISGDSPKETVKNMFNDVNRVPVSSSCPSLGPNNRVVAFNLIPQMADLSISGNGSNTASPTKSKSSLEPYFHSKDLKLSVAGENSKNVLEFKSHLRRVIYQCFSDLASSRDQKEKENQTMLDDVRSLGVVFDRSRVYLFEFILTYKFCSNNSNSSTNNSKRPTILIDAVGVNYTNGGQGMALIFTTLLQYLRDSCKKLSNNVDPLPALHLSLLKFVYQQAKKDVQTASSGNLSATVAAVTPTSFHSKSTSDLMNGDSSNNSPQILSPIYSPTLNASIGSLLFNAVNSNNSSASCNSTNTAISPRPCNTTQFTAHSPETAHVDINNRSTTTANSTLSDDAFLTCSNNGNSNALDLSVVYSPPHNLVNHNFGSPTNCKSSALSAEQQKAINSIAIVSRTASTRSTTSGGSNSTGNLSSPHLSNNTSNGNSLQPPKRLSATNNSSSSSTSSLPVSSTSGGGGGTTKGMRLLQRSKAILSDATNFNYFDKFKNVVSNGGGNNSNGKEQQQLGGGIRGLMRGRKPLIEQ